MEKIKLLLFFSLLSISNVFTQISNEEYYLLTENADNLIENEQFDKALPLYLRLNKSDSLNADLNFKIGVCYINSKLEKKKAVPYLEKAVSCADICTLKEDNEHLMGFSYLGDAYHSNYQFDLAKLYNLLKKYPKMVVEISGHTDSKGNDEYNLILSDQRAKAVVDYLISKNISKNQMVAKGYGETQPMGSNTNSDGSDNPANRQLNRRCELKVIGIETVKY